MAISFETSEIPIQRSIGDLYKRLITQIIDSIPYRLYYLCTNLNFVICRVPDRTTKKRKSAENRTLYSTVVITVRVINQSINQRGI